MATHPLSEQQLRALSHDELLKYTLRLQSDATPSKTVSQTAPPVHSEAGKNPRKKPRKQKKFDISRYGQRLIALRLFYHGWKFHGFSSQTTTENTVEGHLFAALLRTCLIQSRQECDYTRSGRTDVGVSAVAQVIGLRVRSAIVPPSVATNELDFVKIINSALPDGIRVTAWSPVCDGSHPLPRVYPGDPTDIREYWTALASKSATDLATRARRPGQKFSARFDALARSYRYFFRRGSLDVGKMTQAATLLQGTHDFRNFCRIDDNVSNFQRVLYDVHIRRVGDDSLVREDDGDGMEMESLYIFVRGQAFLWHQVRCMAAVLFDVGLGNEQPGIVSQLLKEAGSGEGLFGKGRGLYRVASATPLVFYDVEFPESVLWFGGGATEGGSSLGRVNADAAMWWAEQAARQEILKAALDCCRRSAGSRRHLLPDELPRKHIPYRTRALSNASRSKT